MVSNKKTEEVLRGILETEGFKIINEPRKNGETGVDIKTSKGGKEYLIEVIGYKKAGPSRSKDFYEVFFRAISRLNARGTKHIVIALPSQFKSGWKQRVKNYDVAWPRIGRAFPELEVWFVDVNVRTCEKIKWNDQKQ